MMGNNPPVRHIQIESAGHFKTLYKVGDLAQCLIYDFPGEGRGTAYGAALNACLECMEGGANSAEDARSAFVDAAHEVDLFVLPDDGGGE
jgi:hypothetical protein